MLRKKRNVKFRGLFFLAGTTFVLCTLLLLLILNWRFDTSANHIHIIANAVHPHANSHIIIESNYDTEFTNTNTSGPIIKLYPSPWILINLPMRYILNNDICHSQNQNQNAMEKTESFSSSSSSPSPSPVLIMMLITSHAGDIHFRQRIRQTLPSSELQKLSVRRAFLLGKINYEDPHLNSKYNQISFASLLQENKMHGDLIMGDFYESYRNLTYKHLMGLEWASRYCHQAKYVLKQDDDIIIDVCQLAHIFNTSNNARAVNSHHHHIVEEQEATLEFLHGIKNKEKFFAGKKLEKMGVIRNDPTSKWFVTLEEYPGNFYPDFLSGWGYLTTIPAIIDILQVSRAQDAPYFFIDDVHITGTLRVKAGIEIIDMNRLFTQYKGQLLCCIQNPTASHRKSKLQKKSDEISDNSSIFWCDFLIGPSNDDLDLFSAFQEHSRFCSLSQLCVRRSKEEELNKTCVVTQTTVRKKSKAENTLLPVKGSAKIMRL